MTNKLIESIKVFDGKCFNLSFHEQRMNRSRRALFGVSDDLQLDRWLKKVRPAPRGLFKCRVTYGEKIEKIELEPYQIPDINSLQLVYSDEIDYAFKFKDRTQLKKLFDQRGPCDDVIIVRNGLMTDSYFANLVFWDGKKKVTPRQPLLLGAKRQKYLEERLIVEEDLTPKDLDQFYQVHLINAMIDFGECFVEVENIRGML